MTQTVLLTGITGFIAKRIAFDLLEDGYTVRGSLRTASRADEDDSPTRSFRQSGARARCRSRRWR